ncbi:hypothetical protein ACQEU8_33225 [Streptomyces sp. CA-250714]|uniref:hypothetical protein n=1 Tax=Streptomyces sp. CA-250714 TaxID=3240060 RepID=UPI003D944629
MSELQSLTGTHTLRNALGPDAEELLATHRATGGAVGALAADVLEAAGEVDGLHNELLDLIDDLQDELSEAELGSLDLLLLLLQRTGTDLEALADRFDQQRDELDRLLTGLRSELDRPTGRRETLTPDIP